VGPVRLNLDNLEQPLTGEVVDGRDAIVEFVRRSLSPFESVHHGHMPEITITGRNTAHGIWAMFGPIAVPRTHPVKGFTDYEQAAGDQVGGAGQRRPG
jgi:SnoaL-like domain